jgi:small subunit ribosomal protein S2
MTIPTMEEMLKSGVHFGHQASRWHPKMEPYIYTTRNGIHILDVKKTQSKLEEAAEFAKKIVAGGGDILFVGTKSQARPVVEKYAKDAGMPFIRSRWIGGLLTNFDEVKKNIRRYLDLLKQKEAGEWSKYTKKEQIGLQKEVEKLEGSVSGLVNLDSLPKAIFIVDIRTEKTALQEANVVGLPIIAVCDTNVNPRTVDKVIPANDDATKGIELLVSYVANACKEGLKNRKVVPAKKATKPKAAAKSVPKKEKVAAPSK